MAQVKDNFKAIPAQVKAEWLLKKPAIFVAVTLPWLPLQVDKAWSSNGLRQDEEEALPELFVEANNSFEKNNSSEKTYEGPLEKDLTQMSYEDQV